MYPNTGSPFPFTTLRMQAVERQRRYYEIYNSGDSETKTSVKPHLVNNKLKFKHCWLIQGK